MLAGAVVMIAIRAPHGRRSRIVKVATSHKTPLETGLLVLAWVGFFVPLIWVASPAFSFAEYPLGTGPLVAGYIGSSKAPSYTVIGDVVNVASRVEALNKEFGSRMLITEEVWRGSGRSERAEGQSLADEAPVSRDPLRVRGREMPVRIFQLA